MNRRQRRDAIAVDLADLQRRVERLRTHRTRPNYSALDNRELALLTELSRKAHSDPALYGVDLVALDRPGHTLGGGRIDELAAQPFDLARLSEAEQAEFARLVAKIETLPP